VNSRDLIVVFPLINLCQQLKAEIRSSFTLSLPHWLPGFFPWGKGAGAWFLPFTCSAEVRRCGGVRLLVLYTLMAWTGRTTFLCFTFCLYFYPSIDRSIYLATHTHVCRLRLKRDGTRAETRFRLSPKRTSPFKSAGASVQSTAGSRGVRISVRNAGYTTFRGSMRVLATHSTSFPFTSPPVRLRVPSGFKRAVPTYLPLLSFFLASFIPSFLSCSHVNRGIQVTKPIKIYVRATSPGNAVIFILENIIQELNRLT
jgi:hypothetical protein